MKKTDYSKIGKAIAKHDVKNNTYSRSVFTSIFDELFPTEQAQAENQRHYDSMTDSYDKEREDLYNKKERSEMSPTQVAYKKHETEALGK